MHEVQEWWFLSLHDLLESLYVRKQVLQRTREEREQRRRQKQEENSVRVINVVPLRACCLSLMSLTCKFLHLPLFETTQAYVPALQAHWRAYVDLLAARSEVRETWERLYGREGEHLNRFPPSVPARLEEKTLTKRVWQSFL